METQGDQMISIINIKNAWASKEQLKREEPHGHIQDLDQGFFFIFQ